MGDKIYMSWDSIPANKEVLYPIEELYKSIAMMENFKELDADRKKLEKKLHRYFMKATEEKDGLRKYGEGGWYGKIIYQPNGIMTWHGQYGPKWTLLLEGYKSDYAPPEPEPIQEEEVSSDIETLAKEEMKARRVSTRKGGTRKTPEDMALRKDFPLWHYQLRELKGKRYKPSEQHKIDMKTVMQYQEILKDVSDEEKKLIYKSAPDMYDKMTQLGKRLFQYFSAQHEHYSYNRQYTHTNQFRAGNPTVKFHFLNEEQIEFMEKLCEKAYAEWERKKGGYYGSTLADCLTDLQGLDDLIDELADNEDECIDLTGSVKLIRIPRQEERQQWKWDDNYNEGKYVPYMHKWTEEYLDYSSVIPTLMEQLKNIKNPVNRKVLEKLGFELPPLPEPEEDSSEENAEPIQDTVDIA